MNGRFSPSGYQSRGAATASAIATLLIAATACSSGDSAGASDRGTADTTVAKAEVAKYSGPMKSVYLPPLKKKPAAGKRIDVVTNNSPAAVVLNHAAVKAAKTLGWTARGIIYDAASPTGLTSAFAQAVSDKPNGVITNSLDATEYAGAAKTLAAEHIPVVTSNTTDVIKAPVIANVAPPAQPELAGRLAAAYAVAQKGQKASVAMFNVPSFPILGVFEKGFKSEFKKLCASCHYQSNAVSIADIGTKVPSQVVSVLQRDPSINFAAMGFGAVPTGVPGALKAAGFDNVKIIGIAPSIDNVAAIANGSEEMWVALPLATMGWKSVDALARYFNGESVRIDTSSETPVQILTRGIVSKPPSLPEVVGYESVFEKLWHVN